MISFRSRPLYPSKRTKVSIEVEVMWVQVTVWMVLEKRRFSYLPVSEPWNF